MIWYLIRVAKEMLYQKRMLISGFCILLFMGIGAIYMNSADSFDKETEKQKNIVTFGVVDLDESVYSKMVISYFQGTESFAKFASLKIGTEEELKKMFAAGEVAAYLVLPQGFADGLMMGTDTKIKAIIDSNQTMISVILSNMLDSYDTYITKVQENAFALYELFKVEGLTGEQLRKANFDTSFNLVSKALGREELFETEEVATVPHTPIYEYYTWAIITVLIQYGGILSGAVLLREITSGTYIRLRIVGKSLRNVIAGVVVSSTVIWSVILLGALKGITHVAKLSFPKEGYAFLFGTIVLASLFFSLLASICKQKNAYMLLGNMSVLIMGILGGVVIPISLMPTRFVCYAKGTPSFWMIYEMIQLSNGQKAGVDKVLVGMGLVSVAVFVMILGMLSRRMTIQTGGSREAD